MSITRVHWPDGDPATGVAELTGDAAHHLRQVLRLQSGGRLGLFDGRGREWTGTIATVTKQRLEVVDLTAVTPAAESRVPVTLAIGVLKGDQMDAVVRDATMLGAAAIVPMRTAHVTVPGKALQGDGAQRRWQRVAVASTAQCRRAVVPAVHSVTDFSTCVAEDVPLRLICVEPALAGVSTLGTAIDDWRLLDAPASIQLLTGPEGGWAMDEVEQAMASGARPMSLGPRTLRAETAPSVALTLVSATWGW